MRRNQSYMNEEEVETRLKLTQNFGKILIMTGGACAITVVLAMLCPKVTWASSMLKLFLICITATIGIFSIIAVVTTAITVYFKITALSEEKFKEGVRALAEELKDF